VSIIRSYGFKSERKIPLGRDIGDRIILKHILKDKVSVWIEFIWLRTESSEGYCVNDNGTIGFHKRRN
jgi:hypothetical protein